MKLGSKLFARGLLVACLAGVSVELGADETPTEAELAIKKFLAADGLKVELFASEPLLVNPVSFSIDEQGRFFVAETHRHRESIFDITRNLPWLPEDMAFRTVEERAAFLAKTFAHNPELLTKSSELIRVIHDRDGDGKAEASQVFADGFREPVSGIGAGVLARQGSVWYGCIPDLWRMEIGQDGTAAARKSLRNGFGVRIGVSGHDLHGLVIGPDGKLYFSIGDRGFAPPADIHGYGFTREFLKRVLPDTGAVLRSNPDGSQLEVFAVGLRNPQELAFDHLGNLWTVDNDTAGADKSRVIHVVEGGDYGWRVSYQHMPGFGPWVAEKVWEGAIDDVLPHAGYVAQGPAGLAYNPGTGLSDRFRNCFLICDFPGGIWSFNVQEKGASYEVGAKEKFLWNLWPTDVDFGMDGAVYLTDWVQGWTAPNKGRIYRVTEPNAGVHSVAREVQPLLAGGLQRQSARQLAESLGHADLRVRQEAQFALERAGFESFSVMASVARSHASPLARIHAIRGIANLLDGHQTRGSVVSPEHLSLTAGVLEASLSDADADVRAQAASALATAARSRAGVAESLAGALRDESPRVRFHAALSLGKSGQRESVTPLLEMLRANGGRDFFLIHAGVSALVEIGDFDAIQKAATDASVPVRHAALLAMRRMERPEISRFLEDQDSRLVVEAARAINDAPIISAQPGLAAMLLKPGCPTNALSRAINANFRIGRPENAAALARFAAIEINAPPASRADALDALRHWASPPELERVIGLWRPLPARAASIAQNALKPVLTGLLQDPSEPVVVAAVRAAGELEMTGAAGDLFKLFQNPRLSQEVRREALLALEGIRGKELATAVQLALADAAPAMRREGVRILGKADLPDAAEWIDGLLNRETDIAIKQAAFSILGQSKQKASARVLERWMRRLLSGELQAGLRLDLLESAARREESAVSRLLAEYHDRRDPADPLAPYKELMSGGNVAAGRKIFFERADAACLQCHQIKGNGGIVGPALDGIARKHPKEYLLEALIFPNRRIAAGYENAVVVMKNGRSHAGTVKEENANELLLDSPEEGLIRLSKSEVASRNSGISAMPEGIETRLSKFELRDLLEFLSTLK